MAAPTTDRDHLVALFVAVGSTSVLAIFWWVTLTYLGPLLSVFLFGTVITTFLVYGLFASNKPNRW